jgi:hypothetical protein
MAVLEKYARQMLDIKIKIRTQKKPPEVIRRSSSAAALKV